MLKRFNSRLSVTHTRKINPRFGLLGFLGFMGFLGFLPIVLNIMDVIHVPTFFFFFSFFGFFGFYYEGKMSGTLIDERFLFNKNRASSIANKAALSLIISVTFLTLLAVNAITTYAFSSIMIATIGLSLALTIFLHQYLLYRFENGE